VTHEKLLAKIDIEKANRYMPIDETANADWLHIESVFNALRAIVELANDVAKTIPGDYDEYQIGYKDAFATVIKAIEKELK
jgi:hypothetical protein